jgi:hypothetical protein
MLVKENEKCYMLEQEQEQKQEAVVEDSLRI